MEEGRREEDVKQQHDDDHHRRLNPAPEAQQQPPQKCPRCDSFNTKFCYYNNYSLSQPRYFCKTCRRYWTQGGTLRNVPVGGGCRKGKKAKAASSSSSASGGGPPPPPPPPQPQPPHDVQVPQNLPTNLADHHLRNVPPPMSSYYSGGGFLSSLSAMQSLSNQAQPFNQPLNVAGQLIGGPSNLALLQGFNSNNNNINVPSFSSQLQAQHQQIQHQSEQNNLYPSDQALVQLPNRSGGRYSWNQTLGNNSTAASNPTASTNRRASGTYLNPSQWSDHQSGYGHPP